MAPNPFLSLDVGSDPVAGLVLKHAAASGCGCPVCTGQGFVVETEPSGPIAYLNADSRGASAPNGKPSFTTDRAGLQMTGFDPDTMAPYAGWGSVGQAFTVTYAFRSTEPMTMPDDATGFSRFNTAQIAQAERALQAWADVANIRFVRVGSGTTGEEAYSNSATMLFANYSGGVEGASAFAMFPGNTSHSSSSGDVWINITAGSNSNPAVGNYGGQVLIHEIGHAIGLAHPGDYNADGDTVFTYADDAEYYEDSRQYTVMSYFSESNTGANFGGRYSAAPLLDDIRAAQIEYGANMSTRTGDTVYGFNSTAEREWFAATSSSSRLIFAVWDAGGTDTFDFSGYTQNQVIDLRAGHFSNVGGLTGNVAVAQGVTIENAKGGAGADALTGNAAANSLFGGGGGDTLSGAGGRDFLRGEDGNDSLSGGAEFDDMHGNLGNDSLQGGDAGDWVVGGQGHDVLFGDEGGDVVLGNLGEDTVDGGVGDDVVRGGQGNDVLTGGAGADYVSGDRGDDTIAGGAGADIFHTFAGAGLDRITDFNAGEGDRVNVLAGTNYSVSQVNADVVVNMGGSDQLVLVNVQLATLPAGWIFTS